MAKKIKKSKFVKRKIRKGKKKIRVLKKPKKKIRRIIKIVKRNIREKALRKENRIEKNLDETIHKTKISVIGIGGGAGSIVSEIALAIRKADFIIADPDTKSLQGLTRKVRRFQFGQSISKGLGTGMNEQLGEVGALNDKEKIKELLKSRDLCIIVSCLGGGTSSGASPIFAKISKNLGNLTYGIFTLPFDFEGERKMEMAQKALEKIKPCLNAYSIIPNERIFQVIDKNTPLKSALSAINKKLAENLEGLIEMIYSPGLINIDFADLKTIMAGRGKLSYLNTVEIETLDNEDVVKKAISSSLYPYTIKGAKGVLYNIKGGANLKLNEVSYISKIISESINKNAKIVFGIAQQKNLKNKIKITLLAIGCGKDFILPKKQVQDIKIKTKKIKLKNQKKTLVKGSIAKKTPRIKKTKSKKLTSKRETKNLPAKSLIPKEVKVKVRRNGLELKKAVEEEEKEIIEQEKIWETPAILRKDNDAN